MSSSDYFAHEIALQKENEKLKVEIDRLRVKAEKWDKVVDLRGPMSDSASDYCSADFFNDFEDIFQEVDEKGGGDDRERRS